MIIFKQSLPPLPNCFQELMKMSGHSYYAMAVNESVEQEIKGRAAVGVKDLVKNQSCAKPFRLKDLEGPFWKKDYCSGLSPFPKHSFRASRRGLEWDLDKPPARRPEGSWMNGSFGQAATVLRLWVWTHNHVSLLFLLKCGLRTWYLIGTKNTTPGKKFEHWKKGQNT